MINKDDLIDFDKDIKVQPDEKEPISLEEYLQERIPISEELEKEFERRKKVNEERREKFAQHVRFVEKDEGEVVETAEIPPKSEQSLLLKKAHYYHRMNNVDNKGDYFKLILEMIDDPDSETLLKMFEVKIDEI